MVKVVTFHAAAALALAGTAIAGRTSRLHHRQSSASIMQSDYQNGAPAPGARPGDAAGQTVVIDNDGGHDDNSQRAGCPTIFIGSAAVGGSFSTGWTDMPQVLGFDTMRDLSVGNNVVQPYIIERGKNAAQIKRVIITQPGLPRDYWKYANLVRNSLLCASVNSTMGINRDEILIAAPTWFSTNDASAGSAQSNDLVFTGGSWATGINSAGPNGEAISSFEALDDLIDKFFDKSTYPNLQHIVVAGHSLGGSFTQHYAMLRKANSAQDSKISYFVGNPGAYVWPTSDRPVQNPGGNCASTADEWGYGLQNLPPYGNGQGSASSIASRYYGRNVMYALGTDDNEGGDSHCEAQYQGTSHLSRGQNFQRELESANGGTVPSSQQFNYVSGVAHEDYLIFSDPNSQHFLFVQGTDFGAANPTGSSSSSSAAGASATRSRASSSPSGSATRSGTAASASGSGSQSGSSTSGGASNLISPATAVSALLASSAALLALAL
ncbi:uncharacterized protein UMAG_00072 [Mycosarcoma maydis]|uniref:Fungal lipase-like domain-containing protein n=1 Tax=Mycosarcoma maydis TaxID=5270 RepID=A0A0D1EBB7_MYCMD|nr:uncharacterized protein UMAG_00072 [Ustilago maydis 521]KIS71630.1 hypothetical protein UMAG_00072 [Ustilago maydis 521]|eukprot:XP_011386041.1 hypothetical protein UMAG_00072 [Ustilago maydis 521]